MKTTCGVCGLIDEVYDENSVIRHEDTPKHVSNMILKNYNNNKAYYSKNKDGVIILGHGESLPLNNAKIMKVENSDHHKIRVIVKPQQQVQFTFDIKNELKNEDLLIVGVQLAHPQPQFLMENNPFVFGKKPNVIQKKTSINGKVCIKFEPADIGQYEMPIIFTLYRQSDKKNLIYIREMVVMVQEHSEDFSNIKYPYTNDTWEKNLTYISSTNHHKSDTGVYKIPKMLKTLLPLGLEEKTLENLKVSAEMRDQLELVMNATRIILEEGCTKRNYVAFFHHILWWEETIAKINLRKYNMFGVKLKQRGSLFQLGVPGLAEKRPSLLRGDRVFVRPQQGARYVYESTVNDIQDNNAVLSNLNSSFVKSYSSEMSYDVRFIMSRVTMERMHVAVHSVFSSRQESRVFPVAVKKKKPLKTIKRFYNQLIAGNDEQRSAVEHIASGTHGLTPYIVFGPPGTGKTMTLVEAIIQLVVQDPKNRVLVCTDSNMAADHVALQLLQYREALNISDFILRASSQSREWSVMPSALVCISNGSSYETFRSVNNIEAAKYRVLVTTLSHSAKYATQRSQVVNKLQMTHLFVDEAAQASEPAVLVPITGLLSPNGKVILAGDPKQLGPVCISREARDRALGQSLLERLLNTYTDIYEANPNYMTMLVQNFRSNPDILAIPNELFYGNNLKALAPLDPLSKINVLDLPGGGSAVIFHAVNSREQRMGNAPSYFNDCELQMVRRYVEALIKVHGLHLMDIGVIAPYIRQVYKIKQWLKNAGYAAIEVGTVESFQGKEKRVILVSTVRANCRLLEYDAKYGLGFLVDDKRYNVTLTRAKAKLIIIGNPTCLTRDVKWRKYIDFCKEKNCYFGQECQQIERSTDLLIEIAKTRFDMCGLSEQLAALEK